MALLLFERALDRAGAGQCAAVAALHVAAATRVSCGMKLLKWLLIQWLVQLETAPGAKPEFYEIATFMGQHSNLGVDNLERRHLELSRVWAAYKKVMKNILPGKPGSKPPKADTLLKRKSCNQAAQREGSTLAKPGEHQNPRRICSRRITVHTLVLREYSTKPSSAALAKARASAILAAGQAHQFGELQQGALLNHYVVHM